MAITSKDDLRRTFLSEREKLDPRVRAQASEAITHRLFQLPVWDGAGTVLVYVSFGAEVNTLRILEEGLAKGKRMVVPLIAKSMEETPVSELRSLSHLVPGRLRGILEPDEAHRRDVSSSEIELALVPGVVFDRSGGRLGLGGGYFDRLLPRAANAVRIGLCYEAQLSAALLPREAHDVEMHGILTEREWIDLLGQPTTKGPGGL
jgi:5-formyltetrahydrofolate cyclo-ligase